jgi:adenylate kinase family enzyme
MDRIAMIGCGGSGKTYLSAALAARLSLPIVHLDAEYYDQAWQPMPREQFAARQRQLVDSPQWLIEGNHASTLPIRLAAADTLVFLDLPAITCLAGILQRRWKYRGGQHADGVYDRITWDFVKYIWGYRKSMRPRIRQLITEHGNHLQVVTLTSRRQAKRWLADLTATATPDGRRTP